MTIIRPAFCFIYGMFLLLFPLLSCAQEICNNGLDDDGDGMIDCYDTDCVQSPYCSGFFYGTPPVQCQAQNNVSSFGLNTMWTSTVDVSSRSTMMVADIDTDGIPDVICHQDAANELYVLDGSNGSLKLTINCSAINDLADAIAVGDVDDDGFGEIYVVANDGNLYCYTHTGTPYPGFVPGPSGGVERAPAIHDFNADGIPEILIGNRIFNALTGALIAQGPAGGSVGSNSGMNAAHPVAADVLPDSFCPDCDGPEMICGNQVYSVNIAAGTVTLRTTAPAGLGDGYTAVADMNQDGDPDVVVTTFGKVYIYNPLTGLQIGPTVNIPGRGGRPSIADYDGDNKPEIGVGALNAYVVIEDVASGMSIKWQRAVTDASAATTGTSFDFECDGSSEVVYRDEDTLFIFDGNTGAVKSSVFCTSATRTEYPTVVDVDGDGQANIVCACGNAHQSAAAKVSAFNSSVNQWVPTRKVMNQHSYFVVNINDNLSIPKSMQDHTMFTKINTFITQPASYDYNWNVNCIPLPDFTVQIDTTYFTTCSNPSSFTLSYTVCNNGSRNNPSPVLLSFYNGNPHNGAALIHTDSLAVTLDADSCLFRTITLPFSSSFQLYAYVNDKGTTPLLAPVINFRECDTLNNTDNTNVNWTEITASFSGLNGPYCPQVTPVTLTGTPPGGVFSGNGITGSSFIAANAGVGIFPITYTYTNPQNACVYDTGISVTVNPKPVAGFSSTFVCEGVLTAFTDTSSVSTGTITSYNWSFGNSGSDTVQNPSHQYPSAGSYNVTLMITTDNGCSDTAMDVATVYPNPVVHFTADTVCFTHSTSFNNISAISSGSITQWLWNFGDGAVSSQQNPSHTYAAQGSYTVSLLAVSDKGCADSVSKTVDVFDKPVAAFTASEVCQGNATVFTDGSFISTGSIAQWNYTFGNGQSSTTLNPTHTYAAAGNFTAVLIVTSNNGCTDTATQTVVVNPLPQVSFTGADVCLGNATSFTNNSSISSGSISAWNWSFDDGNTSAQQNPVNTYTAAGNYAVQLTAASDKGCEDSAGVNVSVFALPTVSTAVTPACFQVNNGTATATGANGTPAYSYVWSNGTAGAAAGNLLAGNYTVTVSDVNNCTATATATVTEPQGPLTVTATPANPVIKLSEAVNITLSNSYNDAGAAYSVSSAYGLSCVTCAQFDAIPYQTTNYFVEVTDANGCEGSGEFTVVVDQSVPVFIPNMFSPNGDGANDAWCVYSMAVKYMDVKVFNRWGEKVFETNNLNECWDGSYQGKPAGNGVYAYTGTIVFLDNATRQVKGSVTLLK